MRSRLFAAALLLVTGIAAGATDPQSAPQCLCPPDACPRPPPGPPAGWMCPMPMACPARAEVVIEADVCVFRLSPGSFEAAGLARPCGAGCSSEECECPCNDSCDCSQSPCPCNCPCACRKHFLTELQV